MRQFFAYLSTGIKTVRGVGPKGRSNNSLLRFALQQSTAKHPTEMIQPSFAEMDFVLQSNVGEMCLIFFWEFGNEP
jgi:hypothetical protein